MAFPFFKETMISMNTVSSNDWKVHEGRVPLNFVDMLLVGQGIHLLLMRDSTLESCA
jgi:hypothetical protein